MQNALVIKPGHFYFDKLAFISLYLLSVLH